MVINHTDTETWSIDDIISALGDTPSKKKKIIIPKFQRTLVWNKKQQKAFIDSIKQGFPVGAILLYKINERDGDTMYNLIDGLQRSTALNQYIKAPTQFFDETNLEDNFIDKIYQLIYPLNDEITKEFLSKVVIDWITMLKGFEEAEGFSAFQMTEHIETECNLTLDRE